MDLSFSELALVALIAFLVFGPEDFIRKMAQMGKFVGRLKNQANNFKIMLESEIHHKDLAAKVKENFSDIIEVESKTITEDSKPPENTLGQETNQEDKKDERK